MKKICKYVTITYIIITYLINKLALLVNFLGQLTLAYKKQIKLLCY